MSANYTTAEAAALSRYSPATLRAWRHRGTGPVFVQPQGKGGKATYPRDEFHAWLKGSTT